MSTVNLSNLKDDLRSGSDSVSISGLGKGSISEVISKLPSVIYDGQVGFLGSGYVMRPEDFELITEGGDESTLVPKNGDSFRKFFNEPKKANMIVVDCNIVYGRARKGGYMTNLMTVNITGDGINKSFRVTDSDLGKLIDEDLRSILHHSGITEFCSDPLVIVATIFSSSEPDLRPVVEVPSSYEDPDEVVGEDTAREMSKCYANDMAKFVKSYLGSSFPNFTNVVKIGSFEVSLVTSVTPEIVNTIY